MAKLSQTTYLVKHSRSPFFYFRIFVPTDLCHVVGKKELRYSLRTADSLEAKIRSLRLAQKVRILFHDLRKKEWIMTKEEIDRLLQDYLQECLEESEQLKVTALRPMTPEQLESQLEAFSFLESEFREQLALNDYRTISSYADELLSEKNINSVVKESEIYRYLCRELIKIFIKIHEIEQKRLVGNYEDAFTLSRPGIEMQQSPPSEVLSTLIEMYGREKRNLGKWKEKTESEIMSSLMLLKEFLGDVPVVTIDRQAMNDFHDALKSLPPNVRKDPRYRDKPLRKIIEIVSNSDNLNVMSLSNQNKILERVSSFFNWVVLNGYMDRNPAQKMQNTINKRADEFRDVFDKDDLMKLFHSKDYVQDTHKHSYRFWIPIIGLYTGMRLDEICQLHVCDIYQSEEGVFVIDVNDNSEDKKLKTQSSKRIVPVHDFLINDLKFIDYVNLLKNKGKTRLFPELERKRDGYSQQVSRWFSRYRINCNIEKNGSAKKDFHSFRHTVTNALKQATANTHLLSEMLGHSIGSITLNRYGKRYNPKLLKEEIIDRLQYDIDLSHLKNSRFVII